MRPWHRKAHHRVRSEESMPPDISPEKDDGLHDKGIWGRVKNVVDPVAGGVQGSRKRRGRE